MAGYKKNMAQYENLEGWEKLSLGMQLDKWAIRYGNRIAVTDSEEEITYSELNQKAIGTGQYFMEKGIQKGDKVLVQLPNRISFVVVLFALAKIGAVPIMMLPAHRETELEGIIALAKPSAYIVAERYLGFYYVEMAMAMQKKFPCIQNVFVDGTQRGAWYEAETERQGVFPEVDSYSTAVLLLSGGTTGVPKLIPRTHTDYMYNARMSAKRCQLDESSVYLAALPVAHNFPLCCPGLLGTFDIGGKVVLAPTTSPDDILTAITEEKVTITALVPAMVTVCMEMLEYDEDYDISSLKILQVGGAMLEDSLADKIIEDDELGRLLIRVNSRARSLVFRTKSDAVYVSVPPGTTLKEVKQAIENLRGKLLVSRQKIARPLIDLNYKIDAEHFKLSLVSGEKDQFLANSRLGVMEIVCPPHADFTDEKLQSWLHKVIEESLRRNAKSILPSRLAFLSKQCGLPYSSVKINSSQGRWGSCSARKAINLSYYLVLLPSHLIDYVLLHELCHTREMNHSERFWALLNQFTEGKALTLRGELRKYRTEI